MHHMHQTLSFAVKFTLRLLVGAACLSMVAHAARPQLPEYEEVLYRIQAQTFFGGFFGDRAQGVSVLANGDVLIAGETDSHFDAMALNGYFPHPTPKFFQEQHNGGTDAYVAVLTPNLTQIKYWTLIGGSEEDRAYYAKEDANQKIWVCGFTESSQQPDCSAPGSGIPFPVWPLGTNCKKSSGACQDCMNHECWDVFVTRFSADLKTLESSMVIGGSRHESPRGTLTFDGAGHVYISGSTSSGTANGGTAFFGLTVDPSTSCDASTGSFVYDAFVMKIENNGQNILWSRALGVAGSDQAWANVRVEPTNTYLYFAGCTDSDGLLAGNPSGFVPYQAARAGGRDAFVAKLRASDGGIEGITYLGGTSNDNAAFNDALELDLRGRPVIMGGTFSSDFPTTSATALSTQHSPYNSPITDDSNLDIWVSVLNADLTGLVYSTYVNKKGSLYATQREEASGMAIDSVGNIYITGETRSEHFPTTSNAWDQLFAGGSTLPTFNDAFLTKFFPTVSQPSMLLYSTFLGGTNQPLPYDGETGTRGRSIHILPALSAWPGHVLLSGQTMTSNFFTYPTTGPNTVVFPTWLTNDDRAAIVIVHNTN